MKNFSKFMDEATEAKTCPSGQYWCFQDKKCKKIPLGYHVGRGGHLAHDHDDSKKNGSNGNGNGHANGNGNGNGGNGSSGNGGGNGGGGNGG